MNVKFKKLAMQAGITAALAGASLSAHAVITAVPAPAQLVPYFSWNNDIDTEVRVIVPRAIGVDTVIQLLAGTATGNISTQASWNGTQAGLTGTGANPRIHWFFMDVNSNEVVNSSFPISPDDELYFTASNMPCISSSGVGATPLNASCGTAGTASPGVPSQAGYLIMVNESAYQGGAPTFSFSAEAWLENLDTGNNGLPSAAVIPVLGMADTADSTVYPTPTNNVIENYAAAGAGGPIASPIHTGMRTSTTLDGMIYRVFDIPMQPTDEYVNTIVAWADRNYAAAIANPPTPEIRNGLSGRLYTVNNNEVMTSNGRLTLPNQLNILPVSTAAVNWNTNGYAFANQYTGVLSNFTNGALTTTGSGNQGLGGGFLKFVVDSVALPADWTAQGSYSSVVIFTLPTAINGNNTPVGTAEDDAELAIDTGFFSSN